MRRGLVSASIVSVGNDRGNGGRLTVGVVHSIVVPLDQAAQVGLAPDQVKIREEYGGGFPANVEGLHQLHCLVGLLRLTSSCDDVFADNTCRTWSASRCFTTTTITTAKVKELS